MAEAINAVRRASTLTTHGSQALSHLLSFLFATFVCSQTSLGKLQRTLERCSRTDFQQLEHTFLIRRKSCHLSDHFLDQFISVALAETVVGGFFWQRLARLDETFVQTSCIPGGGWFLVSVFRHGFKSRAPTKP